jgi:hypothetical protein
MNNYLMLGACFLLGILLRSSGRLPANAAVTLMLAYVHELDLNSGLILPALMAWIMFGLGCASFWLAGRALGFSPATIGG